MIGIAGVIHSAGLSMTHGGFFEYSRAAHDYGLPRTSNGFMLRGSFMIARAKMAIGGPYDSGRQYGLPDIKNWYYWTTADVRCNAPSVPN